MEPDLLGLLNQTVTIASRSSRDMYGVATWAAGTTYPARVSPYKPLIQAETTDAAPVSGQVHLDGNVPVTSEDRILLPDGSTPTIVRVDKYTDVNGSVYATRVLIG